MVAHNLPVIVWKMLQYGSLLRKASLLYMFAWKTGMPSLLTVFVMLLLVLSLCVWGDALWYWLRFLLDESLHFFGSRMCRREPFTLPAASIFFHPQAAHFVVHLVTERVPDVVIDRFCVLSDKIQQVVYDVA